MMSVQPERNLGTVALGLTHCRDYSSCELDVDLSTEVVNFDVGPSIKADKVNYLILSQHLWE